MQNADLTWAQDPGAVTELLSGQYFAPLGRSTSHQLWSSAMVILPVVRGLFGLAWDAAGNKLTVTPSLPAEWGSAKLRHVPLGSGSADVEMTRSGTMLLVHLTGSSGQHVTLGSLAPGAKISGGGMQIPLPAVEVGLSQALPEPGSTTQQLKVLDQQSSPGSLTLRLSAPAGSRQTIVLRINDPRIKLGVDGAQAPRESAPSLQPLQVDFGAGEGYVEKTVKFTW
jgi:hypothetical protein